MAQQMLSNPSMQQLYVHWFFYIPFLWCPFVCVGWMRWSATKAVVVEVWIHFFKCKFVYRFIALILRFLYFHWNCERSWIIYFLFRGQQLAQQMQAANPELVEELRRQMVAGGLGGNSEETQPEPKDPKWIERKDSLIDSHIIFVCITSASPYIRLLFLSLWNLGVRVAIPRATTSHHEDV